MSRLLAVDPGSAETGWALVAINPSTLGGLDVLNAAKTPNAVFLDMLRTIAVDKIAIETPRPSGMLSSCELMQTLVWIGRFVEVWGERPWTMVFRSNVKLCLTGVASSKDKNVRQALFDRFGGERHAVGGKRCQKCKGKGWSGRGREACDRCPGDGYESPPGPLHSVSADMFAALGVACWCADIKCPDIHNVCAYSNASEATKMRPVSSY